MKIEASQRLSAVRIVDQNESYSDVDGQYDLNTYSKKKYGLEIGTNMVGFKLAVRSDAAKQNKFIEAFLLHNGVPVGFVSLTRMRVNGIIGPIYMPSSYFLKDFRKMGYAKAIYKWILNAGTDLISGTTQTRDSHMLWAALSKEFKVLIYANGAILEHPGYDTKFIMLGRNNTKDQLIKRFKLADYTVYG